MSDPFAGVRELVASEHWQRDLTVCELCGRRFAGDGARITDGAVLIAVVCDRHPPELRAGAPIVAPSSITLRGTSRLRPQRERLFGP